jgi:hypothetical protein
MSIAGVNDMLRDIRSNATSRIWSIWMLVALAALGVAGISRPAAAQTPPLKRGVLTDMSSLYAEGPANLPAGDVCKISRAAQEAASDSNGRDSGPWHVDWICDCLNKGSLMPKVAVEECAQFIGFEG